jgi:hypothetical protein
MAEMKPSGAGESTYENRRRSHRVNIAMPVRLRVTTGDEPFEEAVHTVSVSAHGCMMRVEKPLVRSQQILLLNTKTTEELPCTVTYVGKQEGGKTEIGIEFVEAAPHFWRIAFPPEDWNPSERKRSSGLPPRPPAVPTRR